MNSARQILILTLSGSGLAVLLLISCKKESIKAPDTALPDIEPAAGFAQGFPKSSGFFSCFCVQYPESIQKENKGQVNAVAVFNDPETYLYSRMDVYAPQPGLLQKGNLNMGKVALNNYPLPWYSGTYSGTPQSLISFDTVLVWKISGVEGAPGFTDRFQVPFPKPDAATSTSLTMRHSQGYTLEVSNYFKNYDSIFLNIPYTGFVRMKPGASYVQLPDTGVFHDHPYWQDSTQLAAELKAFKYYHSRHSGRSYQYLFVTKVPVKLLLIND